MISPGGVSAHVKQPVTDRDNIIYNEKCLMRTSTTPACDLKLDSPISGFLMRKLIIKDMKKDSVDKAIRY